MGTRKHPEKTRPYNTTPRFRKKRCDENRISHREMEGNDMNEVKGHPTRTYGIHPKKGS